jgi:hypothetical protein
MDHRVNSLWTAICANPSQSMWRRCHCLLQLAATRAQGAGQPLAAPHTLLCGWSGPQYASKELSRFNKLVEHFALQTPIEKAYQTTSTMDPWICVLCLQRPIVCATCEVVTQGLTLHGELGDTS